MLESAHECRLQIIFALVFVIAANHGEANPTPGTLKYGLEDLEVKLQKAEPSFDIGNFNLDSLLVIEKRLHTFQASREASKFLRDLKALTGESKSCGPLVPDKLLQLWQVSRFSDKYVPPGREGKQQRRRIVDQIIDHYGAILASKCVHELARDYNQQVERTPKELIRNLYLISPQNYEPTFNEWLDVSYNINKRAIFAQLTRDSGSNYFQSDDYVIPKPWTPFFANTYQELLHEYLLKPCETLIKHLDEWADKFQAYVAYYPYSSANPTAEMIRKEFFDKQPEQFRLAMFARWLCRNAPKLISEK